MAADGEVIRKLLIGIGYKVDNTNLDKTEERTKQTKQHADGLEKAFMRAAAALAAFGVAGKALESIKANLDFEKSLGKIQTLVPDNIAQVKEYRTELLDMSQRTGKGMKDLASGAYEVGSAFGVTNDTLKITELSAKMATAAGAETAESVNLLSAVTLAYGNTTYEANKQVADFATLAANIGKTNIGPMSGRIGEVTGLAKQLGVTQKELFSVIGTAAGITGTTPMMMTQLQASMVSLLAPTKEMKKAYKDLGITSIRAEISQRGLVPTFDRLIARAKGNEQAQKALVGSTESYNLILPLVTTLSARYKDTLQQMDHASGSAESAFDASTKGLAKNAHAAELAEARMDALKVQLGKELAPAYLELIGLTGDLTQAFLETDTSERNALDTLKEHVETMRTFKEVVVELVKMLAAPLIAIAKTIGEVMETIKAAREFIANPSAANADQIAKHMLLTQVHGLDAMSLGSLEFANQAIGGHGNAAAEWLGYDSKGMMAAFEQGNARSQRQDLSRSWDNAKNQLTTMTATIGSLVVNTAPGTTAEQANQIANAASEQVISKIFRRASEALAGPKPRKVATQ